VPAPVAVEPGRGRLLTRDGGTTLLDSAPGGTRGVEVPALTGLLRDCAAMQGLTVRHRDRLVAAGLRGAAPIDLTWPRGRSCRPRHPTASARAEVLLLQRVMAATPRPR
jgi:hypothetical protein